MDESAQFMAYAGQTYYISVDGYSGAVSDYLLDLTCNPPPICQPDRAISCGDSHAGSNDGAGSDEDG